MWASARRLPPHSIAVSVVPMPSSSASASIICRSWSLACADGLLEGAEQVGRRVVVVEGGERGDGDGARDVTRGGAAHAVGDGDQARTRVDGVLVVRADQPDVGSRREAQHEAHANSPAQLQNGLADADRRARGDRRRLGHLGAVEEGAVGRAEILDQPLAVALEHPGVLVSRRSRR